EGPPPAMPARPT
nr:Chain B, 12-mer peptide from Cytoskeleton assembly control protein SLA1 [synthetic construct]